MIFVDTGAWIALSYRNDQHHGESKLIFEKLKTNHEQLITTDYVIDETVTRLRYDLHHAIAVQFLDFLFRAEKTGTLNIIPIDKNLFLETNQLFRKFDSVKLSFTDCTSFVVCQKYKIDEVFAFDHHFRMMNIRLLQSS